MIIDYIKKYSAFFYSVLFSIVIWFIAYLLIPAKAIESLHTQTVLFVISCYLALLAGFIVFNFKIKTTNVKPKKPVTFYLDILIGLLVLSYLLRWCDLFWVRELSFSNTTIENRAINVVNSNKSGILLIIASIIKSVYFFPFILQKKLKIKGLRVIIAYGLLGLPFVEAVLMGARKPFFEVFLVVIITHIIFNTQKVKIKYYILTAFSFFILMSISGVLLLNRANELSENEHNFYNQILSSRYNELLAPSEKAKNYFYSENQNKILKYYALIGLHTGQYISHGLFEFNHIINQNDLMLTKGSYTFVPISKFINKLNLGVEINLENPSPRGYVYLTTFGGLYIDFRWFTLIIMFLLGVFQKYVFQKAKQSIIYIPLLIYLLLINVFLLITNYIRGNGIYPVVAFFLILCIYKFIEFYQSKKIGE